MIDPLAAINPALFIANAVIGVAADVKEYIEDKRQLKRTVQKSGAQTVKTFELCTVALVLSADEQRALNSTTITEEEKAQIFLAAVERTEEVKRSKDLQKTKAWKRRKQ
jgi:hypothetical protein